MAGPSYSVRPNMLAGVETYTLEADALTVQTGATLKRVPYRDMEAVRLIVYPGMEGQQGQSTVTTRAHGKLKIRSHHYVALGDFEDRSAAYAAFLRELFPRVHAANPAARFLWGSGGIRIGWLLVLLCAIAGWVIWIAVLFEGTANLLQAALVFLVLALATRLGLYGFAANKVASFDPAKPPLP